MNVKGRKGRNSEPHMNHECMLPVKPHKLQRIFTNIQTTHSFLVAFYHLFRASDSPGKIVNVQNSNNNKKFLLYSKRKQITTYDSLTVDNVVRELVAIDGNNSSDNKTQQLQSVVTK